MSSGGIPVERYAERLERARVALNESGAAALLIGVGADLAWLTGYAMHALERLTVLVLDRDAAKPTLIVPRLEAPAAANAPAVSSGALTLASWQETEDPFALAVATLGTGERGLGRVLVSDGMRAAFLLRFQALLPDTRFGPASEVMSGLRIVKDNDEVALLRRAAEAADRTIESIARGPLVGRTESDVAREVRDRLVAEGHDEALFAIVASGPNSASPHHGAGSRVIAAGEPIVLDIGGSIGGYGSDITRTLWITGADGSAEPDAEFLRLYGVLQRAQAEASDAARPGVPAEEVDATARRIIDAAGYGEAFFHRTGHGIGLEGHEDPYLVAGNARPLEPGNAFSIEPGIYLDGRYGARIEDIVVCGETGHDPLNRASHDLLVVDG